MGSISDDVLEWNNNDNWYELDLDQNQDYREDMLEYQLNDDWLDKSDQFGSYSKFYKHKEEPLDVRVTQNSTLELDLNKKKFSDGSMGLVEAHHVLSHISTSPDSLDFLYKHYLE